MPEQPGPVHPSADPIEQQLVELGRAATPDPEPEWLDALATTVVERVSAGSPPAADRAGAPGRPGGIPAGRRPGRVRRLAWGAAAAVALVVALVPPVRAAVLELLRIGGVVVREEPVPTPTTTTTTAAPAPTRALTLEQARAMVDFPVLVPAALGEPDSVGITRDGRVVELGWTRAPVPVRLDVFAGTLDYGFLKRVGADVPVTWTDVDGQEAVWVGAVHHIAWQDRTGTSHTEPARLAGPTLVWVVATGAGDVTYRLEGFDSLGDARAVAVTARP